MREHSLCSPSQMRARLLPDRVGLRRGPLKLPTTRTWPAASSRLKFRRRPFTSTMRQRPNPDPIFDCREIYGRSPEVG
jgi:hypothetical protein